MQKKRDAAFKKTMWLEGESEQLAFNDGWDAAIKFACKVLDWGATMDGYGYGGLRELLKAYAKSRMKK